MTNEERNNAIHCLKVMIDEEVCEECKLYGTTGTDHCEADCVRTAIKALEQQPCIQEKQANADKIDAIYIDGFKAGYSQARFDLEQQPCDDVISREMALEKMADYVASGYADSAEDFEEYSRIICQLPSITQKPIVCDDAISCEAVIEWLKAKDIIKLSSQEETARKELKALPPVTPQQKYGKWIKHPEIETSTPEYLMFYECSECGDKQCFCKSDLHKKRFCNSCGAKMQESENKE